MVMGYDEKILVILDASTTTWSHISWRGIREALCRLPLRPGDKLTVLGVLHSVTNPLGYKTKVSSNFINPRAVEEELARKKAQLYQNLELLKQTALYKGHEARRSVLNIQLEWELRVGPSRKEVAVKAAKYLGATWIVLDRQMKKDMKHFLKNLSCRISKMKSDNNIEEVREPIGIMNEVSPIESPINSDNQVSYHEMIPGVEEKFSPTLGKISISPHSQERQQKDDLKSSPEEAAIDFACSICKTRGPRNAWYKDFTYAELHEATEGFSSNNFLSEGGFGSVFMGHLKNGIKIAVKQHKDASLQGEKEFKSEVHVLSQARQENLVMLLGSCSEGSNRLLVYEYVCNGSLDRHLSKDAPMPLTWEKRIKISLGVANGLEYLHRHNIIHRDMRPNNILITHDYDSLLGDFGLAKAQHDTSKDDIVGTLGYVAPEYAETGKFSTKTDVYSFGVVLLQLITGLRIKDKIPHGKSLVGWGRPLLKERNYPDLIDRRIIDSHDFLQLFWMVRLTEKCLSNDPSQRFSMEKVVDILNSIKDGNATCIRDFSPLSDSMMTILDSFEGGEDGKSR